jgi:hypothetical protein
MTAGTDRAVATSGDLSRGTNGTAGGAIRGVTG